jgi:hypothetical protein
MQKICLALLLSLFLPFTAAHAQSSVEMRVHIAAHQSSLGHKIVRSMCFIEAGIDVESNLQIIHRTRAEMDDGIHSMMDGGGIHRLEAEDDWTTRTMYKGLKNAWQGLRKGVDAYLETEAIETDTLFALAKKGTSVDKMWANILKRTERRLADPDDSSKQNLIRLAHAAGAQGAFLQNAGKLACLLHQDQEHEMAPQYRAELKAAVDAFDASAFALTFSSAELELIAPPSEILQYEAFQQWQSWNSVRSVFLDFSHKHPPSDTDVDALRNLSFDIETMNRDLAITSLHYKEFLIAEAFAAAGFDFGG